MLNQVVLSGRLTKDPEIRYIAENQTPVVNITLAVDRDYLDDGERKTDFIPVVAWNNNAKFITDYFGKGGSITVQGRLQSRVWTDSDGKKHYMTELQAEKVYFAGDSRKESESEIEAEAAI